MALYFGGVRTIKGGTIGGTDLSATTPVPGGETTVTFGSSSELWGQSWSYSDINATNFGVGIQFYALVGTSDRLNATNFTFSIPSDQVINGIQFDIVIKSTGAGTASAIISVNHVTCTITTSTGVVYTSVGSFFPFI
jgi:hypothetical protein